MRAQPSSTPWMGRGFRAPVCLLFVGFFVLLPLGIKIGYGASVTLEWDRNPEPDIAGYRLYYGYQSRVYFQKVEVGNQVRFTLGNLSDGTGYTFAVTAFNRGGLESGYSNEVFYATPPASSPTPAPSPANSRNRRPRASPFSFETLQHTPFAGHLQATDPNGDPLFFSITRPGRRGSVQVTDSSTGAFLYTPFPGVKGRDVFRFRAADGRLRSNNAAVRVRILSATGSSVASNSKSMAGSLQDPRPASLRDEQSRFASGASRPEGEEWILEPGTISIDVLDEETITRIGSFRCDCLVEEHEGPWTWQRLVQDNAVDFVSIRGQNILLPVGREHHASLELVRCIFSEDAETMTLSLRDRTYDAGPSSDRLAVCERFPGEDWYIAVFYHEWTLIDNLLR